MRIYTKEARMYNYGRKKERKRAEFPLKRLLNYTKVRKV
jgi:hypothetical protein